MLWDTVVMCEYSQQDGLKADRRLAMSGHRRQSVVRRWRSRRRLHRPTSFIVVQVVSGCPFVVASSPDWLDVRRRRRLRRRHAAESVDAGGARHHRRGLPRRPACRRWTRLLLRRRQSLALTPRPTVTVQRIQRHACSQCSNCGAGERRVEIPLERPHSSCKFQPPPGVAATHIAHFLLSHVHRQLYTMHPTCTSFWLLVIKKNFSA